MKVLSRDFTTKEKALLAFLVLILLALAYYQFVDQPVRSALASAQSEKSALEIELQAADKRVAELTRMQQELDRMTDGESYMASYNNSAAELDLLNHVLSEAVQYSVSFSDVTRNSDQIRRNFTLQFTARNYNAVESILSQLVDSEYRCLVDDIRCSLDTSNNSSRGIITVNATATFFETMVGGTADAGLPADADAAPASVE